MKNLLLLPLLFLTLSSMAQDSLYKSSIDELLKITPVNSLENLQNMEVISVSNTAEKRGEAPANVLVFTRNQLLERGYTNMIEFLQDLPNMDISFTYGDTYYKTYWRGNRSDLGSPYLLMFDGLIFNNLYFNETLVLAAFPMSSIERIEVIYGPASSVYGANAFMGVINVISQRKEYNQELNIRGNATSNHRGLFSTDFTALYKKNTIKFQLTARLENGNANQLLNGNDFYWTKDEHYANSQLWGDLVNNPAVLDKKFSSPINQKALDARLWIGKLEIGFQHFQTQTGYGAVYAADRLSSMGNWKQPETSAFTRYTTMLHPKISSQSLLRYRQSSVSNDSYDLEGYNITNNGTENLQIGNTQVLPKESIRGLIFTYWSSFNASWSFFQNFEWKISEKLNLQTGFKYEAKDLQKAYETYSSELFYPQLLTDVSNFFPAQPPNFFVPQNRIAWTDRGVFAQLKYQPNLYNILYFGYRFDHNSSYGAAPTLRLGYVRKQGNFIFKAFYGEAFQEPPPRLLYGGWTGSGSDPSLKPERSRTAEMTLNYTNNAFSHDLSFYVFNAENSVIGVAGGAKNLGERQVIGLSYGLHGQVDWFKKTTFWLNYSWIIYEKEQKFDRQANNIGEGIIGDLAHHKIQAGINSQLNKRLNANLIARLISDKNTVDANPIRSVEAYLLVDANITYQILRSLTINLKVVNLLNQKYFHTGIRTANGGQSEGFWTNRAWNGSKGFFNSLVPQSPILFSVGLNLDI